MPLYNQNFKVPSRLEPRPGSRVDVAPDQWWTWNQPITCIFLGAGTSSADKSQDSCDDDGVGDEPMDGSNVTNDDNDAGKDYVLVFKSISSV